MKPLLYIALLLQAGSALAGVSLPGFQVSPHFAEQVTTLTLPTSVTVFINAPPVEDFVSSQPTRLVFFALPNGNTIEQTAGRVTHEGMDWHYNIQHIAAQTRRIRALVPEENLVVAYLYNSLKSWPSWRQQVKNSGDQINSIVHATICQLGLVPDSIALTCHSGGGSFIFGYINSHEQIPHYLNRIAFLDANYGYSQEDGHTDKLVEWIQRSQTNTLLIIAYDDRNIMVNGKKVVSETGGTYRKSYKMVEHLGPRLQLTRHEDDQTSAFVGLDGRVDLRIRENPENKILHTVLVEKNGFIHAVLAGSPYASRADKFFGESQYRPLIADYGVESSSSAPK